MLLKSKKKRQPILQEEESDHIFAQETDFLINSNFDTIFEQNNDTVLQQNANIYSKNSPKKKNKQKIDKENFQKEDSNKSLQNIDSEGEIALLEDFNGTELQKAFLYGEIFKCVKN